MIYYRKLSTVKRLMLLKRLSGSGEQIVVKTITGVLPKTFHAVAHAIASLTRYGLCTQDGTPTPDAPVDIVTNNGPIKVRRQSGSPLMYQAVEWLKATDAIPITGFKTKSTQEIETVFYRESSASSYLYWSDTASSGTTNTTAYLTTGAGNWRWDGKTYAVNVSSGIKITSVQNKDGVWLNGTKYGYYTDAGEFVSTNDLSLFSYTNTSIRIYSITIREGETVTLDLVPKQRITDGVYGFYDKVSGAFYTNPDATFEAGDLIDDPIEIYTDGTPEELTVRGKNLFNQACFSEDVGTTITYDTFKVPNGTYTFSTNFPGKNQSNLWYTNVFIMAGEQTSGATTANNGVYDSVPRTITVTDGKFTVAYRSTGTINTNNPKDYNWMLAPGSSVAEYEPYTAQTVTVPMLLGVGDYKDEVELINGIKTGRVGIKVLDGTEDWQIGSTSDRPFYLSSSIDDSYALPNTPFCTHFQGVASTVTSLDMPDFTIRCGYVGYERFLYIKYKDLYSGGANAFKAYLAAQYAAGTPVIVVYPLATETTEQTTPHSLVTHKGVNVVDSTANVEPVEVEIQYYDDSNE